MYCCRSIRVSGAPFQGFVEIQVKTYRKTDLLSQSRGALRVLHKHHCTHRGNRPLGVARKGSVCLQTGSTPVICINDNHFQRLGCAKVICSKIESMIREVNNICL